MFQITDFVWAENDWKVFSCDCDGRMCRFDLFSGKHVLDIIFRNKILKGIAVSSDSKQIYTASHDGEIREMYNRMVRYLQKINVRYLYLYLDQYKNYLEDKK